MYYVHVSTVNFISRVRISVYSRELCTSSRKMEKVIL